MVGPVFLHEWNSASRRSRHRRLRSLYTMLVAAEFGLFLFGWFWRATEWSWFRSINLRESVAELAEGYLWLLLLQHLLLIVFVTPALAAGSVSDEKARGTFTLLLTTELTAGDIVVGKALGQAVQVLVLALPAVPMIALLQGMRGVSPATVGAWAVESVLAALLLSALALLASVWASKTTTAVVAVYVLLTGALVGIWMLGAGSLLDSFLMTSASASVSAAWLGLMLTLAILTAGCLMLAAWRLRPVCAAEGAPRPRARWWAWLDRPAVSDAPVRWKERYVGELGLLAFARKLPRWAGVGLALLLGLLASSLLPGTTDVFVTHGLGLMVVASLLVAVRSSGAISRERERQTWDGLLVTPLEPYALVRGKLWGIVHSIRPYMLAYLAGTLVWAVSNGLLAAFITVVCWLACWPFLYFHAANGLHYSARADSSWRAVVYTLADGVWATIHHGAFAMLIAGLYSLVCVTVVAFIHLLPVGRGASALVATVLAVIGIAVFAIQLFLQLFASAESVLQQAEEHIARHDRVAQGGGPPGRVIRVPRPIRQMTRQ
jgi:ABC-type transport system involved in multi-copper enzyme maturation permease subunit